MPELFPGPVLASLRGAPGRPAFEIGSRTVSRGELLAMVRHAARGLRDAGLAPGMGVGMVLSLSPEAYAAHLAAHALGCRVAAARPGWSRQQLAHALRGQVDAVVADASTLWDGAVLPLREMLSGPDHGGPIPEMARPDDIARLTYTSGSTGQPKACAHTYRAISMAYQPGRWAPVLARLLTHFERCLVHQSLGSPVMFTYLGRCLVAGGTVVLSDGVALPEAIERYGITATMMPPARLDQVLRSGADLSTLRAVVLGGSPASPQLLLPGSDRAGPGRTPSGRPGVRGRRPRSGDGGGRPCVRGPGWPSGARP